jgi:hypothetical protein
MAALRLVCLLPHAAALAIGRGLGRIAERLAGSRRAIVRRNIELCFPDLTPQERNALAARHFEALGMSVIEMGLGRWASDETHAKIARLEGLDHLQQALDSGKGVILLSAHFTTLEISGRLLAMNCPPFDAVYRRNRSEFITELQRTGRERATIAKALRSSRSSAFPQCTRPRHRPSRASAVQLRCRSSRGGSTTAPICIPFCRHCRTSPATILSRIRGSTLACSKTIFAAAPNSTSGYTASSRICRKVTPTTTLTWTH